MRLNKALYGCIQCAILRYKELRSTIISLGFISNPYDICSYTRNRNGSIDTSLIYVDDLFITSDSNDILTSITDALKRLYGAVTSHLDLHHDFLGNPFRLRVYEHISYGFEINPNEMIVELSFSYHIIALCIHP